jgi:hypothetical protein
VQPQNETSSEQIGEYTYKTCVIGVFALIALNVVYLIRLFVGFCPRTTGADN